MKLRASRFLVAVIRLLLVSWPMLSMSGYAQQSEITNIQEMRVISNRIEQNFLDVASALYPVGQDDVQLGRQQLGLDESLAPVPGLFIQNRYNFSQDLRLSIRGFGARSSFGIRGIRIFVDGIPASLPDGQTGVDSIDIGSIGRIEVLRGPSASLYGSAAGGVVNIQTQSPEDTHFIQARTSVGSYDFDKTQLKAGGVAGNLSYLMNLSDMQIDGYREHSETSNRLFNSKFTYQFENNSSLMATINIVDSPEANDPGGITAIQAKADPSSAYENNISFAAGESVEQQQLGLFYKNELMPGHEIMLRGYAVSRDFANSLPFFSGGIVSFDRRVLGAGVQYTGTGSLFNKQNVFQIGVDIDRQNDDRQRFNNVAGVSGDLSVDQLEVIQSSGVYISNDMQVFDSLSVAAALRYDEIDFNVVDEFLADGNDSGDITFSKWSPSISLMWKYHSAQSLYARISTSFETPTSTELANPDGGGGFNQLLTPESVDSYEVGIKGIVNKWAFYDMSFFSMDIRNELVPFELAEFPGRDFFKNAGKSSRQGVEMALRLEPRDDIRAVISYTWSDFKYDKYAVEPSDFDGNVTPGIPRHMFYAELFYHSDTGFYLGVDLQAVSKVIANDANTAASDSYSVANFRAGYSYEVGDWNLASFIGINNFLDQTYQSNVRLNAFGKRYFEPAPNRNSYIGLAVTKKFPQ